jgi:oligosaccharide repeat unit polymerase
MLSFAFILLFFFTPIAMVMLLKIGGERTNRISLITIVTYSIYIFSVIGTFPLFFMMDDYRVGMGVVKKEVVLLVLINSFICIVFLLGGVIYSRKVLGFVSRPILSYGLKRLSQKRELVISLGIIFIFGTLVFYLKNINSIALFTVLSGTVVDATIARSDMGNNLTGGNAHWYSLVLDDLGPLFTCIVFASWLIKKSFFLMFVLITSISLSLFTSIMSIEKAPFINFLASLLITYYLVKHNGIIQIKYLFYFGCISVCLLILFYMLFTGSTTVVDAFLNLVSRLFAGSIAPAYFYLEYYPSISDYLLGQSFPNPGGVMPYVPVRYTIDIKNWVFPELALTGIVGSSPTVFWGEAYINFGWAGVPIVSFLMGILISFISYLVLRLELNPITIGLYVWIIDHYKQLSQTGFSEYLYDFNLYGVGFIILLIILSTGSLVLKRN